MAALPLPVELELDRRSATAVANDIERAMSEAGRNISRDFNRTMSGLGSGDMRRVGRDMGNNLRDGIRGSLNEAVKGVTSQFGAMGKVAESTFAGIPRGAGLAAAGVAGVGIAAVAAGKQLYDLGAQWDSIADNITIRTGAVGSELRALTEAVADVGSITAASLGDIGQIMGQLKQSMPDLAENNTALRQMGSNLAFLAENGQAVNIRDLGKTFEAFGVNAADQVRALDSLAKVSRDTGIPLNQLINTVQQGAPQFKQFGLNLTEATGLLAVFEDAGLDAANASTGLRKALANIGGDDPGQALAETVTQIKALNDAGQEAAARDLAQDLFGTKNFAPFLDAITSGRLAVDGLNKALDGTGQTLQELQTETDDGAQGWQKLTNTIQSTLGPAADFVFGAINTNVQAITGNMSELTSVTSKLAQELANAAAVPITPDSALGRMLLPAGPPGSRAPGSDSSGGLGGGVLDRSVIPGVPQRDWRTGQIRPWNPDTGYGPPPGSSGGPTMPVVPLSGDPMELLQGFQPTSSLYGAAEGVLGARHARAQAEADLNALEASNESTAEEIQAARNKIAEADRNIYQSELRLQEAKQSALDKYTNQLDDATTELQNIGAELDSDFGVSKGLAGIAENITRFLMNLAFAPALGALQAVKTASGFPGDEAGSGLMGILGSSGAFGPQFVPKPAGSGQTSAAYSSSQMGPAAFMPPGAAGTGMQLPLGVPSGAGVYSGAHTEDTGGALVPRAAALKSALQKQFPGLDIGGYRSPDGYNEHSSGEALDIMTGGDTALGNQINDYLLQNADALGLQYNLWQQQTWRPGGSVSPMGDRGSPTQNHMDHIHSRLQPGPMGGPGIPSGMTGGGGQSPIFGAVPQGPGIGGGLGGPGMPGMPNAVGAQPGQAGGNPLNAFAPGGSAPGTPHGLGGFWGGAGPGIGNAGVAPGQSVMGGRQFGQGLPASSGISFNGGIIGAAASMAASSAGAAASFGAGGGAAGAAADIGMQLIGRAIGAGGQYAGNAVGGLMETFMLNDSPLADPGKSWLGRLAIAGAGMRPALPNTAGELGGKQNEAMAEGGKKPAPPLTPQQAEAAKAGAGAGADAVKAKQGDTTNITVNNSRATEDGTGRDIQASLGANQAAKQPR